MNPLCKVLTTWDEEYARPVWRDTLIGADLARLHRLSARAVGETVTDHRSSWVRSLRIGAFSFYVKTYDYATQKDRRRGWLRNTWLAPSRAAREHQALRWLLSHGFEAPRPVVRLEARRWGELHRAVLVTQAWPGRSLASFEEPLPTDVEAAIRTEVDKLHRAGFRDGNLDRRNVLVRQEADSHWQVAFLDSPKFRLCHPSPDRAPTDRFARADWTRLGLTPE